MHRRTYCASSRARAAFTLVELLVAVGVTGLLLALLLPAVQSSRAAARRTECASHLRQLGVALHQYHGVWGSFPTLSHGSIQYRLLPYVGQADLKRRADHEPADSGVWLQYVHIPLFECPADPLNGGRLGSTSYGGNTGSGTQKFGYNGLFHNGPPPGTEGYRHHKAPGYGRVVRIAEVTDGLSNTALMGEFLLWDMNLSDPRRYVWITHRPLWRPDELEEFAALCRSLPERMRRESSFETPGMPWYDAATAVNHVLPPNTRSCWNGHGDFHPSRSNSFGSHAAGSEHAGGVNLLTADGAVRFVADGIALDVWRKVGGRNDGGGGGS